MLLAGHMLPWAAHKTAALTLSGHELAAFTNFTPGAGVFLNEWFYLPLWASALMLSAAVAASASRLARIMGAALAAGVASLGSRPTRRCSPLTATRIIACNSWPAWRSWR